jgi:hypothetical protein
LKNRLHNQNLLSIVNYLNEKENTLAAMIVHRLQEKSEKRLQTAPGKRMKYRQSSLTGNTRSWSSKGIHKSHQRQGYYNVEKHGTCMQNVTTNFKLKLVAKST